jgi:hypothetical protein
MIRRLFFVLFLAPLLQASAIAQTNVTNSNNGTANTLPVYSGSHTLGNSPIAVSGGKVGIGTTAPLSLLDVTGGDIKTSSIVAGYDYNGISFTGENAYRTAYIQYNGGGNTPSHYVQIAKLHFTVNGWVGGGIGGKMYSGPSDRGGMPTEFALDCNESPNANAACILNVYGAYPNLYAFQYVANDGGQYLDTVNIYYISGWYMGNFGSLEIYDGTDTSVSVWSSGNDVGTSVGGTALTPNTSWNFLGGNVGIGTTTPGYALDVTGEVRASGGIVFPNGVQTVAYTGTTCGGDYAESMDVTGERTKYAPGDVLVLDTDHPGNILKSLEPYSTAVAGIYSTKPGTVGRRQLTPQSGTEVPMAMLGVVPTKVTAENGAIHVGDLLVSSSQPGYAMKGTDRSRMLGAVIGKAMGALDSGIGTIEVLVTLQ